MAALIELVVIVEQLFDVDEHVSEDLVELDKDAERDHPGNPAGEDLSHPIAKEERHLPLHRGAFSLLGLLRFRRALRAETPELGFQPIALLAFHRSPTGEQRQQHAVGHQIRVAPNGRGEVEIGVCGQGVVTARVRGVDRPRHRAQHQHGNQMFLGPARDSLEKPLQG